MKLLVLGGGFMQLNLIRKAKQKGHQVVVADYLPDAPGKSLADWSEMTSTFDITGCIELARQYQVDGVATAGTDQPVLTAALVAKALDLPAILSPDTALKATNKKIMKEAFIQGNIPTSTYRLLSKNDLQDADILNDILGSLQFPIVVKPLDSQGQRGVYKLHQREAKLAEYMRDTFSFTRTEEIMAEEFTPGDEITVSAWVEDQHPYILIITDRPLVNIEPHLGVPDAHIFPSKYLHSHFRQIQELTEKIVDHLNIPCGPLYVQIIINSDIIKVVEVACRVGGGHEDELIYSLTGIDILDLLVDRSLGKGIDIGELNRYQVLANPGYAIVKFIKARPGMVKVQGGIGNALNSQGVVNASFYSDHLSEVKELTNSTRRLGFLLVRGENDRDVQQNLEDAYGKIYLLDNEGVNMVY